MEIVANVLVLLHLVGFAALFGGAFVQLKGPTRVINPAMFHGALTQVVTGLLLVGMLEMGDGPVNAKLAVKSVVLVAILVLVLINRKKEGVAPGPFFAVLGLTLLNAGIAVFW